jgi:RNA polymerase sigma-70 factor (ECF subfamily)
MDFETLYERFSRRLHGWAQRRTTGRAEAEDLTQDTFLAIHCSLAGYRGEADLDAWVFGVARNVWRVQARARARHKRAAPRVALEDAPPSALRDERTPADRLFATRALAQVRRAAQAELDPAQWEQLLAYSLERTDLDRLVAETGLSRDALKSRISRARRRLLNACAELGPS